MSDIINSAAKKDSDAKSQESKRVTPPNIPGDLNLSDLLTKTTMPANKKNGFVQEIFTNNATVVNTSA